MLCKIWGLTMTKAVWWGVTPWESCKNRRFRGTYRLNNQSGKNQKAKNNGSSKCILLTLFLARLFLSPWWWKPYVTFQNTKFLDSNVCLWTNKAYEYNVLRFVAVSMWFQCVLFWGLRSADQIIERIQDWKVYWTLRSAMSVINL
jgi:hypothetical protein